MTKDMNNYKKHGAKKYMRLLAAMVSLVLMLTVTGCGKTQEPEEEKNTAPQTVKIMFPEGSSVSQMAALLEQNGVCTAESFMAAANSVGIADEYGIDIPSPENRGFLLEGYLFPDTYEFYLNESAQTAIGRFLKNTNIKLDEEFCRECEELGMTVDEVLSLASVIQKEAGDEAEMKKVSSVLHNRLNSKKYPRLQCDVTVEYLTKYVKPYVSEERYEELKELYNTYKCKGLPEGPITNSGAEALDAALHPDSSDWYFFISDNDGVYHYAQTWEEHQENCERAGI